MKKNTNHDGYVKKIIIITENTVNLKKKQKRKGKTEYWTKFII